MRLSETLRRGLKGLLAVGVVGYSIAHFIHSGVLWAARSMGGDALSAIPTPLMYQLTQAWPSLVKPWIGPKEVWNYGPLVQFLTVPLMGADSLQQASWMLLGVNYVLLAATFILWVKIVGRIADKPVWVVGGLLVLWLNYFPLLGAVVGREYEIWELFLITVGLLALRAKRPVTAGVLLGLAGSVKVLPLIFIPYLFVRGDRKAGWAALLTAGVCTAVAVSLFGAHHSVTLMLLRDHAEGTMYPAAPANQGIINVLYKMFLPLPFMLTDPAPQAAYPALLQRIGLAINAVVFLSAMRLCRRWRHRDLLEIEAALLMIVMVLIPPHANIYYLTFALPALSLGWGYLLAQPERLGVMAKGAWVAAAVCSGFLLPMSVWGRLLGMPALTAALTLQAYSLPAFGAILAALVMAALHRAARGTAASPAAPSLVSLAGAGAEVA